MGGCLQWSVENDETWVDGYSEVWRMMRHGGCLQWSVENDETWVGLYSGVWRMMKHGWMIRVECGEY